MINTIQSETKSAVIAMQAGTQEVEKGVESTSQAGSSLHDIIQMSEQVGDMITHIATAATQQSAASEEINGNIERISQIASSAVSGAQQTAGALQDLSALALTLRELVGQFRLSGGAGGNGRTRAGGPQTGGSSVDFARVKMAHRSWRLKLRAFLDGRENIDQKGLASHRDCELGTWIYADGLREFGHLHEMQALEEKHKGMHDLVKRVVELKHAGQTSDAEQGFSRVCESAEKVIALIGKVEAQVAAPGARAAAAGN